jgi:hemerythrin-like domain-containing protein
MNPQDSDFTYLTDLIRLKKSTLELLTEMEKLKATLDNLQEAMNQFEEKADEAKQLKHLQAEFQEVVHSRHLQAEFQEAVARFNLN